LADAGGLFISGTVYDQVENKLSLKYEDLGEQTVKNIAKPIRVYRVVMEESESQKSSSQQAKVEGLKLRRAGNARRSWAIGTVAGLLLIGGAIAVVRYLSPPTPNPQSPAPSTHPPLSTQDSALRTEAAPAALPLPDKPSIVVLPFVNMSEDPKQDYFSDGITEDLTSDLSKISSLFVISRNSAFTYKGKAVKVQDISRELGVQYVLEGSTRRAGDQVRVTAQLIDAVEDHHLWTERYDRPLKDIFALQDEIVQRIATTLRLQLTLREQGILASKTTDNIEAYDYFLRGLESHSRLTKEANTQARQMWEKAIELDPTYAVAYAALGSTYWQEWVWQWSPDPQNLERAFELAQKAVALDDSLPAAHGLLGYVYVWKKQYEQAVAEEERAIALDPNNADAYVWMGEILNTSGRPQEAIGLVEKAMRLSPRYYQPFYLYELGWAYNLTGRYEEAITAFKQVLSRNPNFLTAHIQLALSYLQVWVWQWSQDPQILQQAFTSTQRALALNDSLSYAHGLLGVVYLWQKQPEQALAEGERAITLNPDDANSYVQLGQILACTGRPQEAVELIEKAMRLNPRPPVAYPLNLGLAYNLAGQYEKAIAILKRALTRTPIDLGIHVQLAVTYSELGRGEEARAEAAEVLRINPNFSLEVARQRAPFTDPAVLERYLAALRKAGLK
jgi:adenylate cyclase